MAVPGAEGSRLPAAAAMGAAKRADEAIRAIAATKVQAIRRRRARAVRQGDEAAWHAVISPDVISIPTNAQVLAAANSRPRLFPNRTCRA